MLSLKSGVAWWCLLNQLSSGLPPAVLGVGLTLCFVRRVVPSMSCSPRHPVCREARRRGRNGASSPYPFYEECNSVLWWACQSSATLLWTRITEKLPLISRLIGKQVFNLFTGGRQERTGLELGIILACQECLPQLLKRSLASKNARSSEKHRSHQGCSAVLVREGWAVWS